MEYRTLPHGGEKISIIGMGTGSLGGTEQEMVEVIDAAIHTGMNLFDLCAVDEQPLYNAFAKAIEGRREQVYTQSHFGMVYTNGRCGPTKDLDKIKAEFQRQLNLFHTDYTDFGFIHCIDDNDELDKVFNDGIWDYMKSLKADGAIRHLGFSSHNHEIARCIIDTGLIDFFMFSINPSYDYEEVGEVVERAKLYRDCESMGIGISVMKPFAGGKLLDAKTSLFKRGLTHAQCMQYALNRPGVMSVLPGVRNMEDLRRVLSFLDTTEQERDYSLLSEFTPQSAQGVCIYCNHCLPCPKNMNIGLINKYYDLAKAGDALAADHYRALPVRADACIKCGHCEKGCPFQVKQMSMMEEIAKFFA